MQILCGVPENECTGGRYQTTAGLGQSIKAHASHEAAFKCKMRQLLKQGYERVEDVPDCLRIPDGGGILVLGKVSQFGAKMRLGKNSEQSGKRIMPKIRTGGIIIG